ncbi:hypothetical protein LC612_38985 [Nostoc sp. CHAB 5834]|nr:hypothetical protein [Nostoc sp. CHAB 5834]
MAVINPGFSGLRQQTKRPAIARPIFRSDIREVEQAFGYLTDCLLATIEGMALAKTRPQKILRQQIACAQLALDVCMTFERLPVSRATEIIGAGQTVIQWAELINLGARIDSAGTCPGSAAAEPLNKVLCEMTELALLDLLRVARERKRKGPDYRRFELIAQMGLDWIRVMKYPCTGLVAELIAANKKVEAWAQEFLPPSAATARSAVAA